MFLTGGRLARTFAFVLSVASALALGTPAAYASGPSDTSQFLADTNGARTSHGIAPLSFDANLTSMAQAWSNHMAAVGTISHNPSLPQFRAESWSLLGENVGMGLAVASLQQAFLNSPMHYRNIIDSAFTRVGIAVAYGHDNVIFVTLDFLAPAVPSTSSPSPVPVGVHLAGSGVHGPTPATTPAPPIRATPSTHVAPAIPPVAASWWRLADLSLLPRRDQAALAAVRTPTRHRGLVTLALPVAAICLATVLLADRRPGSHPGLGAVVELTLPVEAGDSARLRHRRSCGTRERRIDDRVVSQAEILRRLKRGQIAKGQLQRGRRTAPGALPTE
jgi:hypothetical protein